MSSRLWLSVSAKYTLSIPVDLEDARSSSKVCQVQDLSPHHLRWPIKNPVVHVVISDWNSSDPGSSHIE